MNELSRFKPLDHLPLSPGVCLICSGSVGPFIDTSRQLDFEGAVYICQGCIKEMAAQLGLNFVINAEEVENQVVESYNTGHADGELAMMGKFSEFVSNYADRSDRANADAVSVPDDNPVEVAVGAPQVDPKPVSSNVEGDGSFSFQEFGGLPGNPGNGSSLFSLGD